MAKKPAKMARTTKKASTTKAPAKRAAAKKAPAKRAAKNRTKLFDLIKKAQSPNSWDFGNSVLYDLCKKHPGHTDKNVIVAKIWLIGRSYAAAIERRRKAKNSNDDFYLETVAPKIQKSAMDRWIGEAKEKLLSKSSFDLLVKIHGKTTGLFNKISGLEKRSLASKYLHFHVPNLFFIFDDRATKGLSKLCKETEIRASRTKGLGDNEYRKFAEKCLNLRDWINTEYEISLTPRQMDNLLLLAQETKNISF